MHNSFFALVFRQKYIRRWSLMRNVKDETLSEHCAEVAILAQALALIGNHYFGKQYLPDRAAALALYHDVPEVITGDLPTPVKYFSPPLREGYGVIEDDVIRRLLDRLPAELRSDYAALLKPEDGDRPLKLLVKAADKLSAYIKCIEEEKSGNTEFLSAKRATMQALKELNCPEANWFIEHMLPAFSMTIDEIS